MSVRVRIIEIDQGNKRHFLWYHNCEGTVWHVKQDPKRNNYWQLFNHHDADSFIFYRDNERTDLPLFIYKKDCIILPDKKVEIRRVRCL